MKNWMIYCWILFGNVMLFGFIARLLTYKFINNDWGDLVWFICGAFCIKSVKFFYNKTI